jgi:hypothetical protein
LLNILLSQAVVVVVRTTQVAVALAVIDRQ